MSDATSPQQPKKKPAPKPKPTAPPPEDKAREPASTKSETPVQATPLATASAAPAPASAAPAVQAAPPPKFTELTDGERRTILQGEIQRYLSKGYHVVSQTDFTAQLIKGKGFSCLWATFWTVITLGIGLIFYLFWYWSKRDRQVYLQVDVYGRIAAS